MSGTTTGMVCVDTKKTERVEFSRPLLRFISDAFPDLLEDMRTAIEDLSKMRESCVNPERSEKGVDAMIRYYLQLSAMESKLPINENQIHITFTWYDSFYKDSVFSGKRGSVVNSLFERAAILFNIGAVSSQIASAQNLDTDDGLKIAAKYFQISSGAFSVLRDKVVPLLQKTPTPDLSPDVLASLAVLMQAQGQECIYTKAVADKMKEKVTCRLAASAMDFYAEAYKSMSSVNLKGTVWDKWTATVLAKQNYMGGMAEYYQALNAKSSKDPGSIGEELCRLKEADKLMSDAVKQGVGAFECKDKASKINRALAAAQKDNDFIYHERIPNLPDLVAIGRAAVAKPTPLPLEMEGWCDVFSKLVPLNVQQAATMYASRKDHLIHTELTRLREATQGLNSCLSNMNLPAALEDLSGKEVPASLIEKSAKVRSEGGLMKLRQMFNDLPDLLQRNEEIIKDTQNSIAEEERTDQHLRAQFSAKWNRTKSEDINANMKSQGTKYSTLLTNARNADEIVKKKFSDNEGAIEILSKDEAELMRSIPAGGAQSLSQEGQKAVASLKALMDQIKLLKGERDALEQAFKEGGDTEEMIEKFSQLNMESQLFNDEAISTDQLEKVYGPLTARVVDTIKTQDQMLAKITAANDEFKKSRSSSTSDPRSETMSQLAAGYDAFIELQSNLAEGTKFYNNLTKILSTFQTQVNDYVFARNTEKEDLLKTLTSASAAAPAPSRPPPPQFHSQAPQQSAPPPAAAPAGYQPYPQQYPGYGYAPPAQYGGYYTYPGPQGQQQPPQQPQYPYPPQQGQGQYPPGQYPQQPQYPPYSGPTGR